MTSDLSFASAVVLAKRRTNPMLIEPQGLLQPALNESCIGNTETGRCDI
jgi:hypothetical protein